MHQKHPPAKMAEALHAGMDRLESSNTDNRYLKMGIVTPLSIHQYT
jgi:hypothetical protein